VNFILLLLTFDISLTQIVIYKQYKIINPGWLKRD